MLDAGDSAHSFVGTLRVVFGSPRRDSDESIFGVQNGTAAVSSDDQRRYEDLTCFVEEPLALCCSFFHDRALSLMVVGESIQLDDISSLKSQRPLETKLRTWFFFDLNDGKVVLFTFPNCLYFKVPLRT